MNDDDLAYLSAIELLEAYRQRRLSPVEVTRAVLDRIARLNPALNAFCLVDEEAALASAGASESRWRSGSPSGALDGVPASIKDLILTRGWPTLRGSLTVDPAGPWNEDAPATARLREAGAVLLGKTATPEFGWRGSTDSPLTGITRNPWRLDVTPGGSSGGATAAFPLPSPERSASRRISAGSRRIRCPRWARWRILVRTPVRSPTAR
jgi:aspartyl-tRNA(Asn)/glutamyl-tRNA(Gln) amidotransferase subunit A